MTGLVYKSTGSNYWVKADSGEFFECRIKGKFRIQGIKSTNPIAVGDVVDFDIEISAGKEIGVIKHIHDRINYLARRSVNLSKQLHILAANIDQAFLLVTLNNPPTLTGFIDRFLATCEAYDIKVVILFNKSDTYQGDAVFELKFLKQIYEKIGYACYEISAKQGTHTELLRNLMTGKITLLAGHSGVGKSTLVNSLDAALSLKTKNISEQHQQGQHTTTFAEMYDLGFGAGIIDSPGIKGFGIFDMEKEEIGHFFPEFFALKSQCRFHNCLHLEEPGCAVKEALEKEEVAWSRYQNYVQMLDGDSNYREDIYAVE
ncbi:MAG: ribosome small subunit-dependent GTPase A [Flavobacteriales bacterium CG_4_9_14_3_um_filter_40_17]|nr:MAG: ribosome small subunit-dependent GTPase A [Flavobacteriales bacterium CG_4_9_14_3_um_filter_40_17]